MSSIVAFSWVRRSRPRTAYQKLVLWSLADYVDQEFSCYPSQSTIAEDAGISERSVRDALKGLEEDGFIRREERRRPDGFKTSDLIILCVEKASPANPAAENPRSKSRTSPANGVKSHRHGLPDKNLPSREVITSPIQDGALEPVETHPESLALEPNPESPRNAGAFDSAKRKEWNPQTAEPKKRELSALELAKKEAYDLAIELISGQEKPMKRNQIGALVTHWLKTLGGDHQVFRLTALLKRSQENASFDHVQFVSKAVNNEASRTKGTGQSPINGQNGSHAPRLPNGKQRITPELEAEFDAFWRSEVIRLGYADPGLSLPTTADQKADPEGYKARCRSWGMRFRMWDERFIPAEPRI